MHNDRVVFTSVSKSDWSRISTQHDWHKKSRAPFSSNQDRVQLKSIVTCTYTFSRALRQLHVLTSNFDWSFGLSVCFVFGQNNNFGFGVYEPLLKKLLFFKGTY